MKWLVLVLGMSGCSAAANQKQVVFDAYLADNMNCVEKFNTRQLIDACRSDVRARWGVGKDGGV